MEEDYEQISDAESQVNSDTEEEPQPEEAPEKTDGTDLKETEFVPSSLPHLANLEGEPCDEAGTSLPSKAETTPQLMTEPACPKSTEDDTKTTALLLTAEPVCPKPTEDETTTTALLLTAKPVCPKPTENEAMTSKLTTEPLSPKLTEDETTTMTPQLTADPVCPKPTESEISTLKLTTEQVCPKPAETEEYLRLAREGNPAFVYEKLYLPLTMTEIPSFKCWKCPTSVDRMDRLESHYLSHGAHKKFKCKFCDFSGDQMYVILRHEEQHRSQKPPKPPAMGNGNATSANSPVPSPQNKTPERGGESRISIGSRSSDAQVHKSPIIEDEDEPMEDSEVESESDEAFEIGIESGEEMEVDEEEGVKIVSMESLSPDLSPALASNNDSPRPNGSSIAKLGTKGSSGIGSVIQAQQKNGNQAWNCDFCPASFKFLSLKKRHESNHTLNGTYACDRCTYSTKTLNALNDHKKVHGDGRREGSSSPPPSEDSSTQQNERTCRRSSTSSSNLVDEEFERARNGNPEFTYQTQHRKAGSTYKCFACPSSYPALRDLNRHALRHGATDGQYGCRVCDFNHSVKATFINHLERHRAQGNIASHLLVFEETQSSKRKGGVDIGDADEVTIIGNENDFEIENGVHEDEESQGEPEEDAKKEPTRQTVPPPQLSPHEFKASGPATKGQIKPATPSNKSLDMYDLSPLSLTSRKKVRPHTYLLTSMKLNDFMCFDDVSFNLNSDAVTFSGGEGKSTSIIAILLCLGYDILLQDYTPRVICGWEISDLIRRGREVAKIEITLCLMEYPGLREKFGEELKIIRTLRRGVSLTNATFQLISKDDIADGSESPKQVSVQSLRGILKELGVLPLYARMLLLDRQNLKAVMSDREHWYEYFVDSVSSKGKSLKSDLDKFTPIFKRLEGDIKWRKTQLKFLKEQLMIDYPVEEDSSFLQWRNEDVQRLRQVEQDLEELAQKHKNLEKLTESHAEQLASVPSVVLREMRTIYLEFLATQNCIGDILLDENEKNLGIWLREKSSTESEIPITPAETDDVWGKTPQGKRQLGIFGLYLAFWKVNDTCPFFAVDAYSSAELEFKFPTKGLPLLIKLVGSKSGQQFLMSYPEP